jgi:two-component system, response regulator YesN
MCRAYYTRTNLDAFSFKLPVIKWLILIDLAASGRSFSLRPGASAARLLSAYRQNGNASGRDDARRGPRMTYKVFLVEDEIVTREGIRDAVDWAAAGYQFCGEAPDGEIALPLIYERRPETVITDIKMPFMDGLQLCRILRETLPATKIIILSGHDEFKYAQEAIQIGVTEYLLKPIIPQELLAALRKVARPIDEVHQTSAHLQALQVQMDSHRSMLRERCLLDLVTGNSSTADFIEQAQGLEIDLLAPWYQVLVIRTVSRPDAPAAPLYAVCQHVDAIITDSIGDTGAILSFKQGLEETILILKGNLPESLARQAQRLSEVLQRQITAQTSSMAVIGVGQPTERLGAIAQSYTQALAQISAGARPPAGVPAPPDDHQQEPSHSAALIAKARAYIDANYPNPEISLSLVAAQVLLSPTYFSVVFAREVGETFIEYLTNVRIRRAIELLRTTSLTSSEIAYQIGYHNPRYFYSVFRKVAGLPPNEFRHRE